MIQWTAAARLRACFASSAIAGPIARRAIEWKDSGLGYVRRNFTPAETG